MEIASFDVSSLVNNKWDHIQIYFRIRNVVENRSNGMDLLVVKHRNVGQNPSYWASNLCKRLAYMIAIFSIKSFGD